MRPRSAAAMSRHDGVRPCRSRCSATTSRSAISSMAGHVRCLGIGFFLATTGSESEKSEITKEEEEEGEEEDKEPMEMDGDEGEPGNSSVKVIVVSSEDAGEGLSIGICGGGGGGGELEWGMLRSCGCFRFLP